MSEIWANFYPHIQPHVPGCPELVIDDHLQIAAENFCKRSEVWRERITGLSTVDGVSDYKLSTPGRSRLENVTHLYVDSAAISRVPSLYYDQDTDTEKGRPTRYALFGDETIRFYPTPDDVYSFEAAAVLSPSSNATSVPDFLYEDHLQTICYGAISTLTIIPGKEWTNPELAMYYSAKFWKCVDDAKGRDLRRSGLTVQPRPAA